MKYIHRHVCKSMHEFYKICRKYIWPVLPHHLYKGKLWHQQYDNWRRSFAPYIEFNVIGLDAITNPVNEHGIRDHISDQRIYTDLVKDYGKQWTSDNCTVTLVGLCMTNEDNYWILKIEETGEIYHGTCCDSPERAAKHLLEYHGKKK